VPGQKKTRDVEKKDWVRVGSVWGKNELAWVPESRNWGKGSVRVKWTSELRRAARKLFRGGKISWEQSGITMQGWG